MIPVYSPHFTGKEKQLVNECLDTGWISSRGKFIPQFEKLCEDFIGCKHALAVSNGTVALHLAMVALGIGLGDEVIVPTLTYVASVNAIMYVGATPVFCECDRESWQLSVDDVEALITDRTKAIMAVHLYGQPSDLTRLSKLAEKYQISLIEDAAEAFGSYHQGAHVGTFGKVATFSFFGNKTLTTGEGGLVITNDDGLAEEMAKLRTHYVSDIKRYWHDKIGYNYRMTNIQAAIGVAQFTDLEWVLKRKREIAQKYKSELDGLPLTFHEEVSGDIHSYWMCSILVDRSEDRDALMGWLEKFGIETRPLFYQVHTMPMYQDLPSSKRHFQVSESLSQRGINLPSWPDLSNDQLRFITKSIHEFFSSKA